MMEAEEVQVKLRNKQFKLEQRAKELGSYLLACNDAEQGDNINDMQAQYQQELQQVKHAILRIKQGEYETCELCHGPIESKRLLLLPYTALCSACVQEK